MPNTLPQSLGSEVLDTDGFVRGALSCTACDASLVGRRVDECCPRCEAAVSATVAEHWDAIDREGNVGVDQPCGGCGYNLRTRPLMGDCPECAVPVRRTVLLERLADFDPAWLGRIVWGSRLIAWGIVVSLFGSIAVVLLRAIAGTGANTVRPSPDTLNVVLSVITTLLLGFGMYRFLTPHRVLDEEQRRWTPRRVAFVAFVTWLIAFVLSKTLVVVESYAIPVQPGEFAPSVWVGILGWFAWLVMLLGTLLWARRLLRLVPDAGLARFATIQFWLSVVAGATVIVLPALLFIVARLTTAGGMAATPVGLAAVFMIPLGCVLIGWGIGLVVFVLRFCHIMMKVRAKALARRADSGIAAGQA